MVVTREYSKYTQEGYLKNICKGLMQKRLFEVIPLLVAKVEVGIPKKPSHLILMVMEASWKEKGIILTMEVVDWLEISTLKFQRLRDSFQGEVKEIHTISPKTFPEIKGGFP